MGRNTSDARQFARPARIVRSRSARGVMLPVIRRILNPLMMRLGLMAVLHHRGRRSGRSYATPTGARPTADGFVIPMTFGEQADWFRNLREAGGGVIEWNGTRYPLVDPEVVDWEAARSAFTPLERAMLPLLGIENFVRLRHAPLLGA